MVFLSFPDSRPVADPGELAKDYFPATSGFFDRASYGKFRLRPHIQKKWVRMPHTSTSYGIRRDWDAGHRSAYLHDAVAAADDSVDFSRYDMVYFVADPDAPGVDSDATKVVNLDQPMQADNADLRRFVTVFEQSPPDRNVLAHETGHVFDLPDLYHRPQDGKGDWDTYVGDWDLMGSQFGLAPDPFAWHKWKLGWLGRQPGRLRRADRLHPAHAAHPVRPEGARRRAPAEAAGGAHAARTAPSPSRHAVPSATTASVCKEGVLVYRVRSATASGDGPRPGPRRAPCQLGLLGHLRLPAARGRAAGRGGEHGRRRGRRTDPGRPGGRPTATGRQGGARLIRRPARTPPAGRRRPETTKAPHRGEGLRLSVRRQGLEPRTR